MKFITLAPKVRASILPTKSGTIAGGDFCTNRICPIHTSCLSADKGTTIFLYNKKTGLINTIVTIGPSIIPVFRRQRYNNFFA